MNSTLRHIRTRRAALQREIETVTHFEEWEESCVPSYCHPNPLAALVSWWRLYRAVGMAKRHCPAARRALDFGASVGELARLLPDTVGYDFIEAHDKAAGYLMSQLPTAVRRDLAAAAPGAYDWVFAIDALEHNDDYAALLATLARTLSPRGVLVLSGPTENGLYKLGRRIAGFGGHYHKTTIYEIENAATAAGLKRSGLSVILPGLPLFRLSAWSLRSGSRKA